MEEQGKHIWELDETNKQVSQLARMIEKACMWLPQLKELFRMERLCRTVGFSDEQAAKLMCGEKIEHYGTLYSEEHKLKFRADKVTVQVFKNTDVDRNKLFMHINGRDISEWFKEQFGKLRQAIRQPARSQRKSEGFKL